MPTLGELPDELRQVDDPDDEPPRGPRRGRLIAVIVIVALAAPMMIGLFRILGLV